MIKINRGNRPSYYSSIDYQEALAKLIELHQEFGQKRMFFDSNVLVGIRQNIIKLFNNKCAFCESPANSPVYGGIENFRPKSGSRAQEGFLKDHYYWLAYDWENIYQVCNVCSKNKRDFFPLFDESTRSGVGSDWISIRNEDTLLIDPCFDDPEEHLHFENDGTVTNLTPKGEGTIQLLRLNRSDLIFSRKNAIQSFLLYIKDHEEIKGKLDSEGQLFIDDLFKSSTRQGYSASLRAVYKSWKNDGIDLTDLSTGKEVLATIVNIFDNALKSIDRGPSKIKKLVSNLNVFSIKSVEISNFKNIENIKLDVLSSVSDAGKEPWLLLLGDNGIGKSSILQAIAMTLCGKNELSKLSVSAADILKIGQKSGFVKITSHENEELVELHFNSEGFTLVTPRSPTFILAYGATRLLPKGNLISRKKLGKFVNVGNLFDYSLPLSDVNEWLSTVGKEMLKKRVFPALSDLLDLKPHQKIDFKDDELRIYDGQTRLPLDVISDGYKSMIALACDIMKSLSADNANYHSTKGIVLIDELGNHLHPRWRIKVVHALREAFPQLQFIVTTHEPLVLRGLSHGEVAVLVWDNLKKVRVLDSKLLPDHSALRVDQLLTSDLFGLINTLDPDTEKQYEDYYRLLGIREEDRTELDIQKLKKYVDDLASKDLMGSTPQEQVIYEVVHEVYAKNLIENGFAPKEALKDQTIADVKQVLLTKGLDWL